MHVQHTILKLPTLALHPFHRSLGYPALSTLDLFKSLSATVELGEYFNWFVPSQPTSCLCGEVELQTIRHVLLDYPTHLEARLTSPLY
jgi:hypothetical protein